MRLRSKPLQGKKKWSNWSPRVVPGGGKSDGVLMVVPFIFWQGIVQLFLRNFFGFWVPMSHRERASMALAHRISSLCFTGICTAPNDFGAVASAEKKMALREVLLGMMLTRWAVTALMTFALPLVDILCLTWESLQKVPCRSCARIDPAHLRWSPFTSTVAISRQQGEVGNRMEQPSNPKPS